MVRRKKGVQGTASETEAAEMHISYIAMNRLIEKRAAEDAEYRQLVKSGANARWRTDGFYRMKSCLRNCMRWK